MKYHKESELLRKDWNKFVSASNLNIKTSNDSMHIHTPPAFVSFFQKLIDETLLDEEEIDDYGVIQLMDYVFKFGEHVGRNKNYSYDQFTKCECVQITKDDLKLLRQGTI